jgi:hypothetical protein
MELFFHFIHKGTVLRDNVKRLRDNNLFQHVVAVRGTVQQFIGKSDKSENPVLYQELAPCLKKRSF